MKLSQKEQDKIRQKLRKMSNSAKYGEAHLFAKKLRRKYPKDPVLSYYEAVMYGDDTHGRSEAEIAKRHKRTAQMLKPLLHKLNGCEENLRYGFRNEYYWFSHQPRKQYLLGVKRIASGSRKGHYSQGVGAVEVAKKYMKNRRYKLAMRWCKISEKAWKKFFKEDANWYNSYCFYAMAVGLQGKSDEMEKALRRAATISQKSRTHDEFSDVRRAVKELLAEKIYSKARRTRKETP